MRHHIFGDSMRPGTSIYDFKAFGPLAGACWTPGDGDLFVATRQGRAIRFSEKQVAPQGSQGIRLDSHDQVVGIAAVYPSSSVFLLGSDGRGTIRLMEGFSPNKAPGAGGKVALNTDHLVSVLNVDEQQDLLIITKLCKIIRFRMVEIPPKDGVVQGVVCMSLRADEPVPRLRSTLAPAHLDQEINKPRKKATKLGSLSFEKSGKRVRSSYNVSATYLRSC